MAPSRLGLLAILVGRGLANATNGREWSGNRQKTKLRGHGYHAQLADTLFSAGLLDVDPMQDIRRRIHGDRSRHANRRLDEDTITDFDQACDEPILLYAGTGHSAACSCNTSTEEDDRMVCLVDGVDCTDSSGPCLQEVDVWYFAKDDGMLAARATCVFCSEDNSEDCRDYENTCVVSEFDTAGGVSGCALLRTDSDHACSECQPCRADDDGAWGVSFDCYNGEWGTEGQCDTDNRYGLYPFDTGGPVPEETLPLTPIGGCGEDIIMVTLRTPNGPIFYCCEEGAGNLEVSRTEFGFGGCLLFSR